LLVLPYFTPSRIGPAASIKTSSMVLLLDKIFNTHFDVEQLKAKEFDMMQMFSGLM
jgi:hypothetical protein